MNMPDKIKQIKALKIGRGIQYLLNELSEIMGNPIALFDIYYRLLAYAEGYVTDDPLWNELITNKVFSQGSMDFFQEEGFVEAVANSGVAAFLHSDKLKYDRFNGTIYDRQYVRLANINVTLCKTPLTDETAALVEEACKLLSRAIQKSEVYRDLDIVYQETLLAALLNGEPLDIHSETMIKAADIYKKLARYIYIAAAEVSSSGGADRLTEIRGEMKKVLPEHQFFIYGERIVFLISSKRDKLDPAKALAKLAPIFEREGIRAGMSGGFENLFELSRYYNEALDSLDSATTDPQLPR